jgi:hypothetical protein
MQPLDTASIPVIGITEPRSGSRLFCDLLRSHPEIDEVIHEAFRDYTKRDRWRESLRERYPGKNVIPFVTSNCLHDSMFLPGVKRLLLTRRDVVSAAVSHYACAHTYGDADPIPVEWVRTMADDKRLKITLMQPWAGFAVDYDDICPVRGETVREYRNPQLCEFLGVADHVFTTTRERDRTPEPPNRRELEDAASLRRYS